MKLNTNTFIIFFLSIFPFTSLCHAQFQNNNSHTGFYPDAEILNSAHLLWKFKTGGAVRSTPALTGERIIVGSSDGNVYCLNRKTGKEMWRLQTDGPVSSTPVVQNGFAYFTNRSNIVYSVRVSDGSLVWKKSLGASLPYEWGFDYYIGSVAVNGSSLFVGSGDGHLYSLSLKNGSVIWKFKTSSLIRSTPGINGESVIFGDCSGKVYAVNTRTGALAWKFSTIGDTLNNELYGFDRKAVISSPTIHKDFVAFGGRDGFLYMVDATSGKERWKFDYNVSWVISTAAINKDVLVTGTSDGRFIHALNFTDGIQKWRFSVLGPVWASPVITGNDRVVIPGNDGYVYCLDLMTGIEIWRYKIGPQIFSSVVPSGNDLYFGSDDGYIYALITRDMPLKPLSSCKRAVFWMKDPVIQSFKNGMDVYIRDYFIREGYEYYDETDIKDFLLARMKSDTASVIVFATNYFLPSITRDTLGSNILQAYLRSGGKVVILGLNPAAYQLDSTMKQVIGLNFDQAKHITGIPYRYKDLRSHGGFYSSVITAEGKRWGLQSPFVGISGMDPDAVTTPLAIDENGKSTAWSKSYSDRRAAGFVQLYITSDRISELPEVQRAAEYGLR